VTFSVSGRCPCVIGNAAWSAGGYANDAGRIVSRLLRKFSQLRELRQFRELQRAPRGFDRSNLPGIFPTRGTFSTPQLSQQSLGKPLAEANVTQTRLPVLSCDYDRPARCRSAIDSDREKIDSRCQTRQLQRQSLLSWCESSLEQRRQIAAGIVVQCDAGHSSLGRHLQSFS
jgi:hypothetical protein